MKPVPASMLILGPANDFPEAWRVCQRATPLREWTLIAKGALVSGPLCGLRLRDQRSLNFGTPAANESAHKHGTAARQDFGQQEDEQMTKWLPTLITATPEEGFDLAVKLARVAVKATQPDAAVRNRLRPEYAEDADALIAASQVVATHFATVAAANDYWKTLE